MADASGTHPGRMATLAFCLSLALAACTPGQSAAQVMIVCAELADSERTRAVVESDAADGSITHFEIVTPEFLWEAPASSNAMADTSLNVDPGSENSSTA